MTTPCDDRPVRSFRSTSRSFLRFPYFNCFLFCVFCPFSFSKFIGAQCMALSEQRLHSPSAELDPDLGGVIGRDDKRQISLHVKILEPTCNGHLSSDYCCW